MYLLYSALLGLALVASLPYWFVRMLASGKYREGLRERFGRVPQRLKWGSADMPAIWVHAVSVGEVLAVSGLIASLRERFPPLPPDKSSLAIVLENATFFIFR